jgi:hypothetical protein
VKSAEAIFSLYQARRQRLAPVQSAMLELQGVIGGEMMIPLPEINEAERPAVANLIAQTVDQKAMRIASTMPTVKYPERRPGIKRSEDLARRRRQITLGWWGDERMGLKLRERARHAIAYDASAVMLRPDFEYQRPCWKVRDPVSVLPAEMESGCLVPDDVIFAYKLPLHEIAEYWPDAAARINKREVKPDSSFTVLEYVDAEEMVMIVCGEGDANTGIGYHNAGEYVEASRVPNRAGRPLAVIAGRVHLGRSLPRLYQSIGMYQAQAQLFAMELIGMQRSIWPETWFRDTENGTGKIVTMADPIRGIVGHVQGGTVEQFSPTPSPFGLNLADRLERNMRVQTSTPAEFGGESQTNVRTGRRGDSIMSAAIDFELQEIQQLLEASLQEENKIAIAIDKAYFGGTKTVSFYSSALGEITYDTGEVWESDDNYVIYSAAGLDQQELVIGGLQRVGAGTLAKRTFMDIDPMVEDAERENDSIVYERLNEALLSAVQTRAANDPTFVKPLAELMQAVRTDRKDLADAYLAADRKMQEEQAAAAGPAEGDPLAALAGGPAPEEMPGLVEPGPMVPEQQPSQQNLQSLLMGLRNAQSAGMSAVGGA